MAISHTHTRILYKYKKGFGSLFIYVVTYQINFETLVLTICISKSYR